MTGPYTIRFGGRRAAGSRDVLPPVLLDVLDVHESLFEFGVSMTGQAAVGFRDLPEDQQAGIVLEAGLEELEERLRVGMYPPTEGGNYVEQLYSSEDYDRLEPYRDREKRCVWQDRQPGGWLCEATNEGGDDRTTPALCAACPVPDSRVICAHLAHPAIQLVRDTTTGELSRVASVPPMCNIGEDPGDGSRCHIGGLPCAERFVDVEPALPTPPKDVAERAADEIDFFALVYRERYDARVWTIPQARSIADLFGDCADADNFQHRVAALADLLARLDVSDQLSEDDLVNDAGNRVGSMAALERLMARDQPEAVSAVQRLRRIVAARNAFPIHSRSQGVRETLRELGVDFPPVDWRMAWLQVLTTFWTSLRDLRLALQVGASDDATTSDETERMGRAS